MTYEEALAYFTSREWQGSRLGLERVHELTSLMGNPEKNLKCVHIAGTSGKGSTAPMVANVLKEAGYKTGMYTSPNLYHFNERIQINGTPISDQLLVDTICIATPCESIAEGVRVSCELAEENDLVCALGSLYTVGEICKCFTSS